MGLIFSYFRKKKSTKEVLDNLQAKIDAVQEYKESTERRRKKLVGSLVVYSMALYLIVAVICYFYYMPKKFEQKLYYAIPFAAFPPLVYTVKRILTYYYTWKVRRNEKKLSNFKEEKEKLLDLVMETETYKVAKQILETYAPEKIRKTIIVKTPIPSSYQKTPLGRGSGELRKRIVNTPVTPYFSQGPGPLAQSSAMKTPGLSFLRGDPPDYSTSGGTSSGPPMFRPGETPSGPPMPRPILPRERSYLDKFVEYLVGDGPSNRYALICTKCESHNGMALKDEFPYIAFRCVYCHYWNPARKQRPTAPRLDRTMKQLVISQTDEELDDTSDTVKLKSPVENAEGKELSDEKHDSSIEQQSDSSSETNEVPLSSPQQDCMTLVDENECKNDLSPSQSSESLCKETSHNDESLSNEVGAHDVGVLESISEAQTNN